MKRCLALVLSAIAVASAGCTMAPKYVRPAAPVPGTWPAGPAYAPPGTTNGSPLSELPWQDFVADPELRQIVAAALANSRDLRLAALNVERARALYGVQRAELLPRVDGSAGFSRQRVPAGMQGTDRPLTYSLAQVNLGIAAWEVDFFGRIRSLKDRALQEYLASEQARRGVQILLISSVAEAYLALAADRENLGISRTTLQAQQAAYNLVRSRHELGLVPELDVFRAQTALDMARRDVARYTQQVARDENALNLLVGLPASSALLPLDLGALSPFRAIGAGVSSEVLLRRPDVLQAEALLKAAHADIGAARAAFFPRISLTAALGTASGDLAGLFASGSGAWRYAADMVLPIFDARTWSAHRVAQVQREIALTQYQRTIQNAFREVADALAVRGTVDEQVAAQQSLVEASAATYRLAHSRYEQGLDDFLSVLDAQRSLFAAQQALVLLRLERTSSQVRLYAALGGGAEMRDELARQL